MHASSPVAMVDHARLSTVRGSLGLALATRASSFSSCTHESRRSLTIPRDTFAVGAVIGARGAATSDSGR
jgi:hypothetical protein